MGSEEERRRRQDEEVLAAFHKARASVCGEPFTVKRAGETFIKHCTRKPHKFGKHR